ncbi:CLUMA_CG000064, isoform A [Clunio marinus]|uniref:non-specific serine/threonine protein kinase n=1 Tax=Clunio marinus TaxID=568069 RepID=A0A1J1HIV3_9DIPT|nr:CLUMA_CG000064, isoform A [Clunio marinus]
MESKETYRDRQENELEVLKSIFGDELTDLRCEQEKAKFLNIKIDLTPQKDSKISQVFCGISLHVICPKNYPKVTPKIILENPKGLQDEDVVKLQNLLNKEAYKFRGEVMIFELCQLIQNFLHDHNRPQVPIDLPISESFYDTMLKNKQIQDQKRQEEIDKQEKRTKEQFQSDIIKRKEQLLKESKKRRSTVSESSPRHTSSNNSEDSKHLIEVCEDHRHSEIIYIPLTGRKIQKGACLGHSQKGCINYSGIDMTTGQLLYITEWTITNSQLEMKNLKPDELIETIEKKISDLSKLHHKYLVSYEAVVATKRKDFIHILLVQEFLLGISIYNISSGLGWSSEGASIVAKGVLEALIFLHNNGVSHGNILDSNVFMDNSGIIRISDFSFVPYLQDLMYDESPSADLPSLGSLIETLIPTPHLEMRDFINHCKSERTLSGSDLLNHRFLYPMIENPNSELSEEKKFLPNFPPPVERSQQVSTLFMAPVAASDHSRLEKEFEMIAFIGQGAYGDVLKVRNILDNRQYAIKRIPLSVKNIQLYKKMTREVELLSRLNHENVVRYFNSWIETQETALTEKSEEDESEMSFSFNRNSMVKTRSQNHLASMTVDDDSSEDDDDDDNDDSFSVGWKNFLGKPAKNLTSSDNSDGIEFVDSQGRVVEYEDEYNDDVENGNNKKYKNADHKVKRNIILYIQMEFCEKSTLRTAIDGNLYLEKERLWKLFREIVEGLAHIHQQGMIHRDLKPVNIFLDSKDHVKIGDFGLATTSVLALQHQLQADESQIANNQHQLMLGDSQTGQVGTALYVAPELAGNASKSTYNQKVDLYSLGIIFFEMCTPPLTTGMERIKVIASLRQSDVCLPQKILSDESHKNEVQLLKWLLDHNPNKRPTSEELLQSDLLPPAKLEAYELQELMRNVLANPQSRNYKYLIARCLAQESDKVCQLTYHTAMVQISPVFENVKNKIIQVFRKHGAIDVSTPLLSPYTKNASTDSTVKLMSHSGLIVTLPYNLREPLLKYVALNGIIFLRRYSIGRVYREKKIYNFHPKQNYEIAFDIVTPILGQLLVDAELISIANEIVRELDMLGQKTITFRINHTSLLRAIFLYFSVPKEKYKNILSLVSDCFEGKISRLNFKDSVKTLLPGKDQLIEILLMSDCSITSVNSTILKVLLKGRGEASSLAKGAIRELENVINLSQSLGVNIPINLCVGFSNGYENMSSGSIVWQMIGELKPGKLTVLACGGRYDNALDDYQKTAQNSGMSVVTRNMYCAGFSMALDKLVMCLSQSNDLNIYRTVVDLVVYVTGTRTPLKEVTPILKSLWSAGIKSCFLEASSSKEDEDSWARDLGANHIIVIGEDGRLRYKTWQQDRYFEKNVTKSEIIEYVKRNLNVDSNLMSDNFNHLLHRNSSVTSISSKNFDVPTSGVPALDVIFVMTTKINQNNRRRIENQVEQRLNATMKKFSKKETLAIFVIELDTKQVKSLISCIDPNPEDQSDCDFDALKEKFPKYKQKYLQEIYDEITERLEKNKHSGIVGIYSSPDSYFRLIL